MSEEPTDAPQRNSPVSMAWRVVRRGLARGATTLADTLMPPLCLACNAPLADHDALCARCWLDIAFIRPPVCDRLGVPLPYEIGEGAVSAAAAADPPDFDRARAVARYEGVMRELVQDLKYRDRHDARRLLARWMRDAGAALLSDAQVVVPVPLSHRRLVTRRYNQAAIMAGDVARLAGKAYAPLALVRTRHTRRQVGMTRAQRLDNVRGAFSVPAGRQAEIAGRAVLLIDDVITTGATVNAAARALRGAGAARVDVLALAMVVDGSLAST